MRPGWGSTAATLRVPRRRLQRRQRHTGSRRAFVDPKLTERFTLIFLVPNAAAKILCIDNTPTFPQYTLSADARTLEALSKTVGPLGSELDVFLEKQRLWLGIDIGFIHVVSTNSILLLRHHDVPGQDEDLIISRFMMTSNAPPHLRLNLPRERTTVHEAIKAKGKGIINVSDLDSDSEEVEVTHEKHRCDVTASPPRRQRPRLAVVTTLEPCSTDDNDLLTVDSPPPSELSLFFTLTSTPSSSVHTSPSPSPTSPIVALPSRAQLPWPQELYVVNVIAGMLKMDSEDVVGTHAERFAQVFGAKVVYKPSTYDDQV
ncbi:hypothetical protein B0H17DRAFT_1212917 [Mycena rosella]|uniref:Uncharacterized protein n=1 Tax=Mycena rosella TaxID=1033263 RepID=A0AAD7G4R9_MYCRO|nr:hypothetical protein B0H17DRAFT_1212917 [Mycena rosella]